MITLNSTVHKQVYLKTDDSGCYSVLHYVWYIQFTNNVFIASVKLVVLFCFNRVKILEPNERQMLINCDSQQYSTAEFSFQL